jgi:two-component sensor histidine kinase
MRNRWITPRPRRLSARTTELRSAGSARESAIDADLYVFALCRQLQMTCLDRRDIDCRVDVEDVGRLPTSACRLLGLVVTELVNGASECSSLETMRREIAVTVRRRGTTCLCTVACRGLEDACRDEQLGVQRAHHLAAEFDGGCTVQAMPERGLVAVMFDAASVERQFSGAIWRYRAAKAWGAARHRSPSMLG